MKILDGKKLNSEISERLKAKISQIGSEIKPKLVIVKIGEDSASGIYVNRKVDFAARIGADCEVRQFGVDVSESDMLLEIANLNSDVTVTGVILQLPIPATLNKNRLINSIHPDKDVDGLGAVNISKLVNNDATGIVPATARGVVTLLKENGIEIEGRSVVIVGRSLLVGKSTALHFLNQNATVTVCHSKTADLNEHLKKADIIVAATGQPGLIKMDQLGENQVIVDVGISVFDGKISGDVHLNDREKENSAAISPVPGGVGPMTVASLFENLIEAFKK